MTGMDKAKVCTLLLTFVLSMSAVGAQVVPEPILKQTHYPSLLSPSVAILPPLKAANRRELATLDRRYSLPGDWCNQPGIGAKLTCVYTNPSPRQLQKAVAYGNAYPLDDVKLERSRHNGWILAMLLAEIQRNPHVAQESLEPMRVTLRKTLEQTLRLLNGRAASVWHGRFSLACQAFFLAVALAEDNPSYQKAYAHFSQAVWALQITESWPGGYNYWVNNRAIPFLLASLAYIQTTNGQNKTELIGLIERIGLWQIYMTRPDDRFAAVGDEGPRVDLKDESKRVIDLMTLLTGSPYLATYAEYLFSLHGSNSYYQAYR